MKFSHEFRAALARENFPEPWLESALQYRALKKCIKKVEAELAQIGFDYKTLSRLTSNADDTSREPDLPVREGSGSVPVAFRYEFKDSDAQKTFLPKLTVFVQLQDGVPVSAALSPDTKSQLEDLAARLESTSLDNSPSISPAVLAISHERQIEEPESRSSTEDSDSHIQRPLQQIEVPLTFDAEFFGLLQGEVTALDTLQKTEQTSLSSEIQSLSTMVRGLSTPSRFNKKDLEQWRALFELYLEAGIFFSTHEQDHGARNSVVALKQLQWFQNEVSQRRLVQSFKLPASRDALARFMEINLHLLQNLKFQEINHQAVTKILKKFDKRTSLGVKETFPKLIHSSSIMSETMSKAVCAELSTTLVNVVPQLDDYLCPVCFTIAWKPVRLACQHIFCIRCMIKMQTDQVNHCPLCRDNVVMAADANNLDEELMSYMKRWFPRERKEKQRQNEIEAGVEVFGEAYRDTKPCIVM